jgi:hypothetical protein
VFVSAQQALFAMVARPGYGRPRSLPIRDPPRPPDDGAAGGSLVRTGGARRLPAFVGRQPTVDTQTALYADYAYTAVPVGDGPSTRRSFAVFPDGVIRFRRDGAPPDESDQMLGTEK